MIEYPYKCRVLKHGKTWTAGLPCCECQFIMPRPDMTSKEIEEYHGSGVWHNENCEYYGKDVFDNSIELEFEDHPDYKLIITKYKWEKKDV